MRNLFRLSGLLACCLALEAAGATLGAQEFAANQAARRLKVVTETNFFNTTSTTFVNVTGASTNITVPSGWTAGRVLARFSGESGCGGDSGWCAVRILVDGVEISPASGTEYAFDEASASGDTNAESSYLERTTADLVAGSHTVTVQAAVVSGAAAFTIDDWALTIVLWRVS